MISSDGNMRNYKKTKFKYTLLFPKVRVKGMSWVFHKGDDDDRPSVPHGHSTDNLYRLQLWTGNIYEAQTGKLKYKAKKKDIKALYNYPGFLEFVNECREEYMKRHPSITLKPLSYKGYRKRIRAVKPKEEYRVFIRFDRV